MSISIEGLRLHNALQEVLAVDLMEAKLRVDCSFTPDSYMNFDRHDVLRLVIVIYLFLYIFRTMATAAAAVTAHTAVRPATRTTSTACSNSSIRRSCDGDWRLVTGQ